MKANSYLLISEHLVFFHDEPMKPTHCTGNFIRLKRQSNNEFKTKLKNSIKFFEKVSSKPLKPESISLKISILSTVSYVERQNVIYEMSVT